MMSKYITKYKELRYLIKVISNTVTLRLSVLNNLNKRAKYPKSKLSDLALWILSSLDHSAKFQEVHHTLT